MTIQLGNLSIDKLQQRTGWNFSKEDYDFLIEHRQDNAQETAKNKFHIFDIPFMVLCGEEIKDEITKILVKYNNKQVSKEPISIAWSEE